MACDRDSKSAFAKAEALFEELALEATEETTVYEKHNLYLAMASVSRGLADILLELKEIDGDLIMKG